MVEYVEHSLCRCRKDTAGHRITDITKDGLAQRVTVRICISGSGGGIATLVVATEIDDGVRTDDGVESDEEEAGDGVWMSVEDVSEEDNACEGRR